MTKEELIDFVEFSKEHWTFVTESGKRFSGEQVIEALKREPCEDAISRQKMLKYFEGWKNQIKYYHPYAKNFDIPYEEAVQWVKDMPPVNPQKPIRLSAGVDCEDCPASSSEKPRLIDPAYEKTLNKWIGAEVLDRIRNEMHATAEKHEDGVYYLRDEWVDEIIDKYAEEDKA